MPLKDSISIKLNNLNGQLLDVQRDIVELKKSTENIRIFTDYQMMIGENKPQVTHKIKESDIIVGNILIFLPFIILGFWLFIKIKNHIKDENSEKKIRNVHTSNWFWVCIWIILAILFLFGLSKLGMIHPPINGFEVSHLDLILAIASIIAVIGAVWAVFARIDAEKAFNESKRTRLSFGNSFKFHSIIHDQKLNYIIDDIGEKGSTVTLYLGFPIVGWFCKDFDRVQSLNFIVRLQSILQQKILNPIEKFEDFKLHIGLFTKLKIDLLLTTIYQDHSISEAHKTTIKSFITTLYEVKRVVGADSNLKQKVIFYEDIPDYGEKFRFSSVNNDKTNKHKALIWIIPDFIQEQDETEIMFESACFQTLDITIIEMLHEVFKNVEQIRSVSLTESIDNTTQNTD